jgi:secondary thiamine-phosphate synthase enzyme
MIKNFEINFSTKGNLDIVDITNELNEKVADSGIKEGLVSIFVPGATGALTTLEYEPGLISDFKELLSKLIPKKHSYHHNRSHFDGNAHSHLQASLIGPSLTILIEDKNLVLGTWQQIVFIDCDNRSRKRNIKVKIIGE